MIPRPHYLRLRARVAATACAALLIGACSDSTAPVPVEGTPDELAFNISALEGGTSTDVRMDGAAVVVTRTQWTHGEGTRTQRVRAVPTTANWAAFWNAVENAGVHRWTGEYEAAGIVDGTGWSLRLAGNGAVMVSHGTNAYPDREGREHEIYVTADFRAFTDALSTLTGWQF